MDSGTFGFLEAIYGLINQNQAHTLKTARHIVAHDACFMVWRQSAGLLFAGTYQGLEEGERLFRHFFSLIEAPPDHDPLPCYRLFTENDGVMAVGHSYLRPRNLPPHLLTTPLPPMPISYLFRFQGDKIVYFEDRFDTAQGGQLLGTLSPPKQVPRPHSQHDSLARKSDSVASQSDLLTGQREDELQSLVSRPSEW